jgi:hypothetical protein
MRFTTAKTHKTSPIDSDRIFFEEIHPCYGLEHLGRVRSFNGKMVQKEGNLSRLIAKQPAPESRGPYGAARCGRVFACTPRVPCTINSVSCARQPAASSLRIRRTAGIQPAVSRISASASSCMAAMSRERAREPRAGGPRGSRTTCSTLRAWHGVMIFVDCVRHAAIGSITRAYPNGRNEAVISKARSDTSTVR